MGSSWGSQEGCTDSRGAAHTGMEGGGQGHDQEVVEPDQHAGGVERRQRSAQRSNQAPRLRLRVGALDFRA